MALMSSNPMDDGLIYERFQWTERLLNINLQEQNTHAALLRELFLLLLLFMVLLLLFMVLLLPLLLCLLLS